MMQHQPYSIAVKNYLKTYRETLQQMMRSIAEAPLANSVSHNFISQVIPLQRGAIQMCQNILQYTINIPLQNIALHTLHEQNKSIQALLAIQPKCEISHTQTLFLYQQEFQNIANFLFTQLRHCGVYVTNNNNLNFINQMVPHHRGVISMAENALQYAGPVLQPMLHTIITIHDQNTQQMECLRKSIKRYST